METVTLNISRASAELLNRRVARKIEAIVDGGGEPEETPYLLGDILLEAIENLPENLNQKISTKTMKEDQQEIVQVEKRKFEEFKAKLLKDTPRNTDDTKKVASYLLDAQMLETTEDKATSGLNDLLAELAADELAELINKFESEGITKFLIAEMNKDIEAFTKNPVYMEKPHMYLLAIAPNEHIVTLTNALNCPECEAKVVCPSYKNAISRATNNS